MCGQHKEYTNNLKNVGLITFVIVMKRFLVHYTTGMLYRFGNGYIPSSVDRCDELMSLNVLTSRRPTL